MDSFEHISHPPASPLLEEAARLVVDSVPPNSRRARRADLDCFVAWCRAHNARPLPAAPETLVSYLVDLRRTHKPGTLKRRVATISKAHQMKGLPNPARDESVREVMRAIRRTDGAAPHQHTALDLDYLRRLMEICREDEVDPDDPARATAALRDRALLLCGWVGCFRRSELVALDCADVGFAREGLELRLRRSKTDQEGFGSIKRLPYGSNLLTCPVRTLREWLETAAILEGPLFRPVTKSGSIRDRRLTAQSVALILKRRCAQAGLDPAAYSAHSLRSGFATTAAQAGAAPTELMQQGGWRSERMALYYIKNRDAWKNNPAGRVGL